MKTKTKPKVKDETPQELVTTEPRTARLAILTRITRDKRSRCARLDGGGIVPASKGGIFAAKVTHVGMVEYVTIKPPGCDPVSRWIETENLAEFDGPTSEDAADTFIKLLPKRTRKTAARCIADGTVTGVATWRQRGVHDGTTVRFV